MWRHAVGAGVLWTGALIGEQSMGEDEMTQKTQKTQTSLAANTIRATLLFLLEVQPEPPSDLLHASVGVATFTLAGVAILGIEALLRRGDASRARSKAYASMSAR